MDGKCTLLKVLKPGLELVESFSDRGCKSCSKRWTCLQQNREDGDFHKGFNTHWNYCRALRWLTLGVTELAPAGAQGAFHWHHGALPRWLICRTACLLGWWRQSTKFLSSEHHPQCSLQQGLHQRCPGSGHPDSRDSRRVTGRRAQHLGHWSSLVWRRTPPLCPGTGWQMMQVVSAALVSRWGNRCTEVTGWRPRWINGSSFWLPACSQSIQEYCPETLSNNA